MLVTPLLVLLAALPAFSAPVTDTANVERAVGTVDPVALDERGGRGLGALVASMAKSSNLRIAQSLRGRDARDARDLAELADLDARGIGALVEQWLKNNPKLQVSQGTNGRVGGSRSRSRGRDVSDLDERDLALDERDLAVDERDLAVDERNLAVIAELAKRHPGLSSWLANAREHHGFARPSKNPNWRAPGNGGFGPGRRDASDVSDVE